VGAIELLNGMDILARLAEAHVNPTNTNALTEGAIGAEGGLGALGRATGGMGTTVFSFTDARAVLSGLLHLAFIDGDSWGGSGRGCCGRRRESSRCKT
jgi:hypothetical protein